MMAEKYMEVDLLKMAIEAEPFFTDSTKAAFRNIINKVPAVDAVEAVRCGDCKHWLKDFAGCTDNVGRCEWANYMVGAAGYCVYGERREGNG